MVKKLADGQTVNIPQLDLEGIIKKQSRKMYPFNINTQGELVELTDKESSLDTHNDEDAIIIYDEQDQEDDMDSFKKGNEEQKYSDLFNSSFFSDLSSVQKSKKKDEPQIQIEKDFDELLNDKDFNDKEIIINDKGDHNSFLDQDLNIDSIQLDEKKEDYTVSVIEKEEKRSNKNILEAALGLLSDENTGMNDNYSKSLKKHNENEAKLGEVRNNNFMRTDSQEKMSKLNQFVAQTKKLNKLQESRDDHSNILNLNEIKCKSVPADNREILNDHPTFGYQAGAYKNEEPMPNDYNAFEKSMKEQKSSSEYSKDEESKIRNKSVVIPRSSILIKNKKNIQKLNTDSKDQERFIKNYSVSPSRLMMNSKHPNLRENEEDKDDYKDKIKYTSLKNYSKAKINFKSSNALNKDSSLSNLKQSSKKKKRPIPFKFIKSKKNPASEQYSNYAAKSMSF